MSFRECSFDASSRSDGHGGSGKAPVALLPVSSPFCRHFLEKDFYHEHSTTSQRTTDVIEEFHLVNQISIKGHSCPKPILTVEEANFPENVISILQQQNWVQPRPMQAQCWPLALSGRDLVCIAQAGLGKKLSYIIPSIVHISHQPPLEAGDGPICLVLVPTGELVQQVAQVASLFGSTFNLRITCLYGCVSNGLPIQDLARGAEICIATPDGLLELLEDRNTNLGRCTYLVLDAADRMLDMGYQPHIRQIVNQTRPDRQTLMWSATWPEEVQTLAELLLSNYPVICIGALQLQTNPENLHIVDVSEQEETRTTNALLVGQEFDSYATLSEAISTYQKTNGIQFYRRDARKIASNRVKRPINAALSYYDLRYCCIHGGRQYVKSGSCLRDSSTYRVGCAAYIHIRANDNGTSLVVRSINDQHNHEVYKELHRHLPQQRRLPGPLRDEVKELLKLKANKKLVQHYVVEKSGNLATLKDLSNLMQGCKEDSRNDLPNFVERLQNKYGATVDVIAGEDGTLRGLVFQDAGMKDYMRSFPEVLFVDATYKLLEIRLPIYLTLCEDSMGNSEVVSVGMLTAEDEDSLLWLFQTLRLRNPDMDRVRVLVTDKDLKERQVLRTCFPNSFLILCLFHTLRAFRREITCEKMGISAGQRSLSLELLQKLAYARSEIAYNALYEQFSRDAPQRVVMYYNDNWHGIRKEWVKGFVFQVGNFLNFTNNRLECINSKLKSVVSKSSSLEEFLESLYVILEAMRLERDSKAAKQYQKTSTPAATTLLDTTELQYARLLTPYAAEFVRDQLSKNEELILREIVRDATFAVDTIDCVIEVSPTDCSCIFRKSMLLPCKHIFAVRRRLSLDLFCDWLCNRRWHTDYFKAHGRVFAPRYQTDCDPAPHSNDGEALPGLTLQSSVSASHTALTGPKKVKIGLQYGSSLANLHADVGTAAFWERVEVYKNLERLWQVGKRAVVVELSETEETQANPDVTESTIDGHAQVLPGSIFANRQFKIFGLGDEESEFIACLITQHGGSVLAHSSGSVTDYGVVPVFGCPIATSIGELVTSAWVQTCIERERVLPVESGALFSPMVLVPDARPLSGCIISLSGFKDIEREVLIEVSNVLGGRCQDNFVREAQGSLLASTHLVIQSPQGQKYAFAKKWSIPAVNKMWLFECACTGTRTDVQDFVIDNNPDESCFRKRPVEHPSSAHCSTAGIKRQADVTQLARSTKSAKNGETDMEELAEVLAGDESANVKECSNLDALTAAETYNDIDSASNRSDVDTLQARRSIKGIKLPPRMRRCGRPKGQETTVIGLPKQRGAGRMLPFSKLPTTLKEKIMLSWFVAPEDFESALKKQRKITANQVQSHPVLVPAACIDEQVDMNLVRDFFSENAWQAVEVVLRKKAKTKMYTCGTCKKQLGVQSVACDCCLRWYDFKCVALKAAPKASRWFCGECRTLYAAQ